jgi:hypothetical protein
LRRAADRGGPPPVDPPARRTSSGPRLRPGRSAGAHFF